MNHVGAWHRRRVRRLSGGEMDGLKNTQDTAFLHLRIENLIFIQKK